MGSVQRRIRGGFAALVLLFVATVLVQLFVDDSLRAEQDRRATRLEQARDANRAALQHLTDAETGLRGFQLTGERMFVQQYDAGRKAAFAAFDRVASLSADEQVLRLLAVERQAASDWLYAYAMPIVDAAEADPDDPRAARGKGTFDQLRAANADLDAAVRAAQRATSAAARRQSGYAQLLFAGLAVAFLATALVLATVHQRHLLAPLEHIRVTLQRLAAGDLSARAVPAGPREMRAVIGSLNGLAAQTERLLDAEQTRNAANELRQAVATALRDGRDPEATARRTAELIARALRADAVHERVTITAETSVDVCWPAGSAALPAQTVEEILAGDPGTVMPVKDEPAAIAVALGGDADCAPGLIYLVRRGEPVWTAAERRLVAALGREIDHAHRRRRLHLRQALLIDELRALDERKDAFVSTVTHELRTPLTSILGYTEMLADGDGGDLSPLQRRGVTAIMRNAERLQDTVANLLLLDGIANRVTAAAVPVELALVAAGVAAETVPLAEAKGLVVQMDVEPVWVSGDARQLERSLRNLIDNAIKFTGPGGRVSCRIASRGDRVTMTVTDTGIGIPDDDLRGLFTPFHRAGNAIDRAVQGPGLGLAVVRNIITEHGGAVTVHSRLGHGSTFTVTLPALATRPADDDVMAG